MDSVFFLAYYQFCCVFFFSKLQLEKWSGNFRESEMDWAGRKTKEDVETFAHTPTGINTLPD